MKCTFFLIFITLTYTLQCRHANIVSVQQMYDNTPDWDYVQYRKKKCSVSPVLPAAAVSVAQEPSGSVLYKKQGGDNA